MNTLLRAAAVALVATATPAFAGPGFVGSWTADVPGPSGQRGLSVTFTFEPGDNPSGSVTVQGGQTLDLVNVKIEGDAIAFQVEGEEQNLYSGQLSGDQIKMLVKYRSHENGTRTWSFVATRATPTTSDAADIEGDWTGAVPRGGGQTIAATFSFHAAPPALTGNVHALDDDFPVVDGSIVDHVISFSVGTTKGRYTGIVDGDRIQMKVKYNGGETGRVTLPFVLTREGR